MDRVTACAQEALRRYDCHPDASVTLLNVSENATFLVSDPGAEPSVLRVHRLGYHTEQEIASELTWMDALRAEAGVRTPRVLPAADGQRVVTVAQDGRAARHCVRFEFLPGTEPGGEPGGRLTGRHFEELGEITARMHRHARGWARPAGFARFHWDYAAAFGDRPVFPPVEIYSKPWSGQHAEQQVSIISYLTRPTGRPYRGALESLFSRSRFSDALHGSGIFLRARIAR